MNDRKEHVCAADEAMYQKQMSAFNSPEGRAKEKKYAYRLLAVSLILSILFAALNWGVITDWGKVKVSRLTLSSASGDTLSILLYVPKTATPENPAPAVICYHGNSGSGRNHESWAMEFARRGFVVAAPDLYGAGNSGNISSTRLMDYNIFAKGAEVYRHLESLNYVDSENILTSGHSLGGTVAFGVAALCDGKGVLSASDGSTFDFGNKTAGEPLFDELYDKIWAYHGDTIITYGDSGKYDGKTAEWMVEYANQWLGKRVESGYEPYAGVEYTAIDQLIGSFEDGNAFMVSLDNRHHEGAFVTQETISKLLDFGMKSVDESNVANYIDPDSQTWMAKDFLGLLGCLSYAVFIIALALSLIEAVPFFAEVKRAPTRNIGLRGAGMAISVTLGIALPFAVLKTKAFGIQDLLLTSTRADTLQGRGPFHMSYSNFAFSVVIGLTLVGIVGFVIYLLTDGKRDRLNFDDLGLTESGSNRFSGKLIGKTSLLAVSVVAIAFALLQLQETWTGTTFYAWFFGFKALDMKKIPYYLPYIAVWIFSFIFTCFTLNVERRLPTTGNEILDDVLQVVFNTVMATAVVTFAVWKTWYYPLLNVKGIAFFNSYGTGIDRIYGMPLGITIATIGNTVLFRKTRNTWLCAMLMGTIAALLCVLYGQFRIYPI